MVVAGSSSSRGLKSSAFSKVACDNLRCLQCNFTGEADLTCLSPWCLLSRATPVHWFADSVWDPAVDYMFLRNNMPNDSKLSARLQREEGSVAYCCQCSWTHEAAERPLAAGAQPQWVCAGH